jgi:chromosome partitioning protein
MAKVVAVANQKGGVAKTTTVQAVGVALAERGLRILVVDLDPQACLTFSFGIDPDGLEQSMHDVLLRRAGVGDVSRPASRASGLTLAPASIDLAGAEVHLLGRTAREHELARALEPVLDQHDVVLVDCPPSLGVLTINGLTAAESVIVPLQCEALSHRGVDQLLETVDDVRTYANEKLTVLGVVATMYDGRTRHSREVLEEVRSRHGLDVLGTPIPKSIRFAESPALGMSILEHAPHSAGAQAYRQLADEILRRLSFDPMAEHDVAAATPPELVAETTSVSTISAASWVTR